MRKNGRAKTETFVALACVYGDSGNPGRYGRGKLYDESGGTAGRMVFPLDTVFPVLLQFLLWAVSRPLLLLYLEGGASES